MFTLVFILTTFFHFFRFRSQIVILFEITYKSPDDEAGNFEPRHLIDPIQRQHHELHHTHSDSMDDDQQKLLDIEQNIANLEKNMNRGKWICPSNVSVKFSFLMFFCFQFSVLNCSNKCHLTFIWTKISTRIFSKLFLKIPSDKRTAVKCLEPSHFSQLQLTKVR